MASKVDSGELIVAAQSLPLDEVPADTLDHTRRVIADTIGVILGGGQRPEIEALIGGDDPLFPAPVGGTAQLLVPDMPRADPTAAAFVNATAAPTAPKWP